MKRKGSVQKGQSELSSASDGNFLECLNMSLHIFEKHHTDRSLHRTGQMILVISAGVGIFDVDHTGNNFAAQNSRIKIDC